MADLGMLLLLNEIAEDEEIFLMSNSLKEEVRRKPSYLLPLCAAAGCIGNESHARVLGYTLNVIPQYSDEDFRMHFRLRRTTVAKLTEEIGHMLSRCDKVRMETKILSSLWILSNQESFRGVADRFGLEKGHLHRIFMEFCDSISSISQKYIEWPNQSRAEVIMRSFEETSSLPGVIGCIDGSYINIAGQETDCRASYINRKGNSSMQLQAVCDNDMKFIDIYTGWPGSVHDARVLRASPLFEYLEHNGIHNDGHLLGDSAYPAHNFLLTPYRDNGHLNEVQKKFNFLQSSCRSIIERAFAQLKGKFRRLKFLDMHKIEKVPVVIMTACVLHNYTINYESSSEMDYDQNDFEMSMDETCDNIGVPNEKSCAKRDRIANSLLVLFARVQYLLLTVL